MISDRPAAPAARTGRWWLIPWYPAAFPIAFVVMMWSGTGIEPIWFVRPMIVAVALTLLMTIALTLLLQDRDRGGLAATAFAVGLAVGDARAAAAIGLIGLGIVADGLARRGTPWLFGRVATRAMTALGSALILVVVASTVQQGTFLWAIQDIQLRLDRQPHAESFDPATPDIFVILLDGYPGDDAARLDPDFDADAFPGRSRRAGSTSSATPGRTTS